MTPPAYFQTIAEIGIGLAGFSGLIVALRRKVGPLSHVLKFRMKILFALSFGAMFLALLPYWLQGLQIGDALLWRLLSALMSLYSVLFVYSWFSSSRRLAAEVPEIFDWRAFATMSTGHFITLCLLLGATTGLLADARGSTYGLTLIWYLVHASQQFVRMLFVQPRSSLEADS